MDLEGKWKSICIGGVIIGLGPFVPFLNLACCIIPIVGSIVAVAVYRNGGDDLSNTNGVILGAMSALFGTVLYAILVVPITMFFGETIGSFLGRLIPELADVPSEIRPLLDWLFKHLGTVVGIALMFKVFTNLALNLIFGILGGLLGVAIFKRR